MLTGPDLDELKRKTSMRVVVDESGNVDLMPEVKLRARMIEIAASLQLQASVPSYTNIINGAEKLLEWVLKNEQSSAEAQTSPVDLSKLREHSDNINTES